MPVYRVKKGVLVATLVSLATLLAPAALAYIDPGTGGLIASSGIGFVWLILLAIGGFFARKVFKPVKRFVVGLFKKNE